MKLSPRERTILLLAGLLAVGYAGVVYAVDPLLESQAEVRERIEQTRLELGKLTARASERSRYEERVETMKARISGAETILMQEDKVPVVAAQVQEFIHQLGQETGVAIVRESVLHQKEKDLLTEIPVELSLKGSLRDVHHFLHKIETHEKLLTVNKLAIRSSYSSDNALSVELQIVAHMPKGRNS
ncbi:type II secretion system protein GspM [Petrachloros mirabilis]